MHPKPISPGPGQESVWDYPRPPALEPSDRHIRVIFNGHTIVDSRRSHPPVYYLPPEDADMSCFLPAAGTSFCEWKGQAHYYTIAVGERQAERAAWYYPMPTERFAAIAGYIAIYPGPMDACYVDEQQVQAQSGSFYGGWITDNIVGPFKGSRGTWGW